MTQIPEEVIKNRWALLLSVLTQKLMKLLINKGTI